ncbi:sororin [Aplochiton taeniatus]
MDNKIPQLVIIEPKSPQRRRSARLCSPPQAAAPISAVKRSITVKKLAPRKTQVSSVENKENEQRLSEGSCLKKPRVSTPGPVQAQQAKATLLSPILDPSSSCPQPAADPKDAAWSQKVRRSYSRLSLTDQSFHSPDPQAVSPPTPRRRETLFGFEMLNTPEVVHKVANSKDSEVSRSLCGVSSFTLCEGDDCGPSAEPDVNIPGVALVKEKKRRKKVTPINITELDVLAAKMNAEFEKAEEFTLVVE